MIDKYDTRKNIKKIAKRCKIPVILIAMAIYAHGIYQEARDILQINKQVEEYEKSLPGYWEQKQRVEHYRDSLMYYHVR